MRSLRAIRDDLKIARKGLKEAGTWEEQKEYTVSIGLLEGELGRRKAEHAQ